MTSFEIRNGGQHIIHDQRRLNGSKPSSRKSIRSTAFQNRTHSLARENLDFEYELREAYFELGSRPGYRILFTVVNETVNVLTIKAAEEDWISPDEVQK